MRYLSKPELRRLLEVAKAENPLDHLLILVTYLHALRVSEVINLHIGPTSTRIPCIKNGKPSTIPAGYVDSEHLVVWRLKGSLRTAQPLIGSSDPLFDERGILATYPHGPLFVGYSRHTANNRIRKYGRIANIPNHLRFIHALKHSCLFHAINASPEHRAKINELQAYAGHKSGSSTMRYLVCDEESASRAVVGAIMAT